MPGHSDLRPGVIHFVWFMAQKNLVFRCADTGQVEKVKTVIMKYLVGIKWWCVKRSRSQWVPSCQNKQRSPQLLTKSQPLMPMNGLLMSSDSFCHMLHIGLILIQSIQTHQYVATVGRKIKMWKCRITNTAVRIEGLWVLLQFSNFLTITCNDI